MHVAWQLVLVKNGIALNSRVKNGYVHFTHSNVAFGPLHDAVVCLLYLLFEMSLFTCLMSTALWKIEEYIFKPKKRFNNNITIIIIYRQQEGYFCSLIFWCYCPSFKHSVFPLIGNTKNEFSRHKLPWSFQEMSYGSRKKNST